MEFNVTKTITKKITSCWHRCPHFGSDEKSMVCNHPFFDGSKPYENMIISWNEDIQNDFPSKCPLRNTCQNCGGTGKISISYRDGEKLEDCGCKK